MTRGKSKLVARVIARTPPRAESSSYASRVPVAKTYKMFVAGAFVRSDGGLRAPSRGEPVTGSADPASVSVPRGSRKDVRDAVLAAQNAGDAWAARTAYNRGQILYRLAEMMESRREELRVALVRGGQSKKDAVREVDGAIDRTVYYAGFCDKFQALIASSNPVAGPFFSVSAPAPMGVVGVIAPARPALLGLVSTVLPALTGGNASVVLAGAADPRTALVWCECVATSDMPGGVVNVLTGDAGAMATHLARHRAVAALDVWSDDADLCVATERDGSESVKRVRVHDAREARQLHTEDGQGLGFIERFVETKTIWHTVGT